MEVRDYGVILFWKHLLLDFQSEYRWASTVEKV